MLTFVRQHEDRLLGDLKASERTQLLKLLGKVMLAARGTRPTAPKKSANGGSPASTGRRARSR
jgi:hypothetical protein